MTKDVDEITWTFEVNYKSDWKGFKSSDNSTPSEGFIPNGNDLKITFWAKSADLETEVQMVGDVFRIPLPVSKVSSYFVEKSEFVFYPYFFMTEGDFVVMEVDSGVESIGTRDIVVYLPPGFKENTRPGKDYWYIKFSVKLKLFNFCQ